MKFKLETVRKLLNDLTYNVPDGSDIEITIKEEDAANGSFVPMMSLKVEYVKKPQQYDTHKTDKHIKRTVEIFAESENRPARLTLEESQLTEVK